MPHPKNPHHFDKPASNDDYFERMCRIIFMSGLNWATLEKKWPGIKKAFADFKADFKVDQVANFDEPEVEQLMQNTDVIRNRPKIEAVIKNTRRFQDLIKEHGSFAGYLDILRPTGEAEMQAAISREFAFMGKGTTVIFLFAVGENLPTATQAWQKRHQS